ncbi:MAG: hypothetical protein EU549_05190 [Promethearchaeota archaeon]|nr:MAG: hypothetical protein EU549_05190 [Candidatus Lokiarchaeota archaeon]
MRKRFGLLIAVFFMLVVISATQVNSSTTQWFPGNGTVSEYGLSHIIYYDNGTMIESDEFDIYEQATDYYLVVPSIMKVYFTPKDHSSDTSIMNDTEVRFKYTYSEKSSTTWTRSKKLMFSNYSLSFSICENYLIETSTYLAWQFFYGNDDEVDKDNFFTSTALGSFIDYCDCSLGIGDSIYQDDYPIMAVSNDLIIAQDLGTSWNSTLIAYRNGRIKNKITTYIGASTPADVQSLEIYYTLIEQEEPAMIPGFPLAITAFGIIVGVLLIKYNYRPKFKSNK